MPGSSAAEGAGKYQIVARDTGSVWLLNTETGDLRLCALGPIKDRLTIEEVNQLLAGTPSRSKPARLVDAPAQQTGDAQ
jgi:hypothetical protein